MLESAKSSQQMPDDEEDEDGPRLSRAKEMLASARLWLTDTDRLALATAASLILKLLLARRYVLGQSGGFGAVADAAAIVALVAAAALGPARYRRPLLAALAVAVPIVMLAGVMYTSYFGELPSIGLLAVSGQLGSVSEATGQLLRWEYLLFVIDLPLLLLGPRERVLRPATSRFRMSMILATCAAVALVTLAAGDLLAAPLGPAVSSVQLGFLASEIGGALASAAAAPAPEAATLQDTVDRLTGHAGAPRHPGAPPAGSLKGKNVIVVQMESLQAGLIGARLDGKPIVPNLEKLVAESAYFPNTYSQIGRGNTSDAEFVTNTSLYPCKEEPSAVAYAGKTLPGMPRLLAAEGYASLTMHTNVATYWNRDHLYPALGFETVFDKGYFGDEQSAGFGASDHVLYTRGMLLLQSFAIQDRPFYAELVTVSAHYPFTRTGGEPPLELPADLAETETGRYLAAQSYADAELGKFVKKLRKNGLLEKSILVVYGDHFGLRMGGTAEDKKLRKEIFGHSYNASDFYNVPLIIRTPGGKSLRDASVVGQIDIMPTIADLLGLDLSRVPHFGKSAFSDSPTLLTRASSVDTYITDDVAFFQGLAQGDGSYSPSTHKRDKGATAPAKLGDARRLVELSQQYARGLPDEQGSDDTVGHIPASAADPQATPYR